MFSLDMAGIAISAFFIFSILSKKHRKGPDTILVLINVTIIGLLVADALFQQQLTAVVFLLLNVLPLLLFPLFLIFALEVLQEKIHHRGRWVLLFAPALFAAFYMSADLFVISRYSLPQLRRLYDAPTLGYHLLSKGLPLLFIGAFVWLLGKLRIYSVHIRERYSFIDPIELRWLTQSTWIYLIITILSLVGFISSQFSFLPITSHFVCNAIGILLFLAIFYLSFHGIRAYTIAEYYGTGQQPAPERNPIPPAAKPDEAEVGKYKTSSLTEAEQQTIFQKLVTLFEEQTLYREPKLQLSDVADALHVSPHFLSQTINATTGKPFYDFVNSYRVRHLQGLLKDPTQQKFTILALGMESGFNSKASLNRVFRQETGLSPSEFAQRHQAQLVLQ